MKKNIAAWLRRVAQWLDPQKDGIPGCVRKVVDYVPYYGIDQYRELMLNGDNERAMIVKMRIRQFAEVSATACLAENLNEKGVIRLEHNFGTRDKVVNGITCPPEGVTVIVELKSTWS